jgi:hypothetical protein
MSLGTLFSLFIIPVAYTFIVGERRLALDETARGGTIARTPADKA